MTKLFLFEKKFTKVVSCCIICNLITKSMPIFKIDDR